MKERSARVKYNFVNNYLQKNSFVDEICKIINDSKINKKINIFDGGPYLGNFSRQRKKYSKKQIFIYSTQIHI